MRSPKILTSAFLAFSLLQTTGCNLSAQVGGSENQIKASVGDVKADQSAAQAVAQAKEETRLANERAKLEEDKRRFAEEQKTRLEEQLKAQNAEDAPDTASDVTEQPRHSYSPRRTRRADPRYNGQSHSYYQPYSHPPVYVQPSAVTSSADYDSSQRAQPPVVRSEAPLRSEPVVEYIPIPRSADRNEREGEEKPKKKGFWKKALPWIIAGGAAAAAGVAVSRSRRH